MSLRSGLPWQKAAVKPIVRGWITWHVLPPSGPCACTAPQAPLLVAGNGQSTDVNELSPFKARAARTVISPGHRARTGRLRWCQGVRCNRPVYACAPPMHDAGGRRMLRATCIRSLRRAIRQFHHPSFDVAEHLAREPRGTCPPSCRYATEAAATKLGGTPSCGRGWLHRTRRTDSPMPLQPPALRSCGGGRCHQISPCAQPLRSCSALRSTCEATGAVAPGLCSRAHSRQQQPLRPTAPAIPAERVALSSHLC